MKDKLLLVSLLLILFRNTSSYLSHRFDVMLAVNSEGYLFIKTEIVLFFCDFSLGHSNCYLGVINDVLLWFNIFCTALLDFFCMKC